MKTFTSYLICFHGRSVNDDRGSGGMWEILPAAGHAGRDAGDRWKSLLEQVSQRNNIWIISKGEKMALLQHCI